MVGNAHETVAVFVAAFLHTCHSAGAESASRTGEFLHYHIAGNEAFEVVEGAGGGDVGRILHPVDLCDGKHDVVCSAFGRSGEGDRYGTRVVESCLDVHVGMTFHGFASGNRQGVVDILHGLCGVRLQGEVEGC